MYMKETESEHLPVFQYILVVFARDDLGADLEEPLEIQVVVEDLNDNKPVCENLVSQFEVQENEEIGKINNIFHVRTLQSSALIC